MSLIFIPGVVALVGGRRVGVVASVDGRAAFLQRVRERVSSVVCKRQEPCITVQWCHGEIASGLYFHQTVATVEVTVAIRAAIVVRVVADDRHWSAKN